MMGLPDLGGIIEVTKDIPEQFNALCERLDRVVDLLTEQNDILREQHRLTR